MILSLGVHTGGKGTRTGGRSTLLHKDQKVGGAKASAPPCLPPSSHLPQLEMEVVSQSSERKEGKCCFSITPRSLAEGGTQMGREKEGRRRYSGTQNVTGGVRMCLPPHRGTEAEPAATCVTFAPESHVCQLQLTAPITGPISKAYVCKNAGGKRACGHLRVF